MVKYYFFSITSFLTACALASLFLYQPMQQDLRLRVVATTTIIADAVRAIAGEQVYVHCLMGPGVDPHLYRATEGDMRALYAADLVLYNGLDLEGKMSHLFAHNTSTIPMHAVSASLADTDILHEDDSDAVDPHLWHDPLLFDLCCAYITHLLTQHAPEHAESFQKNYQKLHEQLITLDEWIRQQCNTIAPSGRILVTAHDAFAYFARRYGFTVASLQGISTQTQVGLKDISTISDLMIRQNIPTLFTESSTLDKPLQAIVLACNDKGWPITIGQALYSDALGAPESNAATYIQMMRYNTQAIVSGLKKA